MEVVDRPARAVLPGVAPAPFTKGKVVVYFMPRTEDGGRVRTDPFGVPVPCFSKVEHAYEGPGCECDASTPMAAVMEAAERVLGIAPLSFCNGARCVADKTESLASFGHGQFRLLLRRDGFGMLPRGAVADGLPSVFLFLNYFVIPSDPYPLTGCRNTISWGK